MTTPTPNNHDTNSTGYCETHQQEYSQCITTPNNQDDELDKILDCVYNNGRMSDWKVSETKPEDILPWMYHEQAKAAILNWHNQQLGQAVIDARKDEIARKHNVDSHQLEQAIRQVIIEELEDVNLWMMRSKPDAALGQKWHEYYLARWAQIESGGK